MEKISQDTFPTHFYVRENFSIITFLYVLILSCSLNTIFTPYYSLRQTKMEILKIVQWKRNME